METQKMTIKIDDGVLSINLSDILDVMTDDHKREFMKHAIWQKDIFEDLIYAIVNDHIVTEHFGSNIYDTRKQILENIGKLETNHFRSLMHELEQSQIEKDKWQADYWKLYNSLSSDQKARAPRTEPYQGAKWASDAKVEQEMAVRS
jgi:IS1 family transposase